MNGFKRRCAFILIILCMALPSLAYAASTELDIRATTNADGTVSAEIVLDGSLSASGVQFALGYDPSMLHLSSRDNGNLNGSYTVNDTSAGLVRLVWYSTSGADVNGEASLLKLNFSPVSSGNAQLWFDNATPAMVVDENLSTVQTAISNTNVNVTAISSAPAATGAPLFIYSTATPTFYMDKAPTPTPAAVTPSPKPSASPSPTPKALKPESTHSQTDAAPGAQLSASPEAVQITAVPYEAPVLADTGKNAPPTPENPPTIDVLTTPQKESGSPWLYILIGAVLVAAAGYFIYKKRQNTASSAKHDEYDEYKA